MWNRGRVWYFRDKETQGATMKLLLVVSSIVVLPLASHAADLTLDSRFADENFRSAVSGDIAVHGGAANMKDYYDPDYDGTGGVFGASARANVRFSDQLFFQLDVNGEFLSDPSYDGDYSYAMGNVAGHVSRRDGQYLYGVFGSVGFHQSEYMWDAPFASAGVEGQINMGRSQLYVQTGATASFGEDDGDDIVAYYFHGEVRHFANPNLMISANAGAFYETYDGEPLHGYRWGADIEKKYSDASVGAFVSYQGNYEAEPHEDEDWLVSTFLAGFRIYFDEISLEEGAKAGARLRDMNPLTGVNHSRYNDWE